MLAGFVFFNGVAYVNNSLSLSCGLDEIHWEMLRENYILTPKSALSSQ
jgi:hypothetical protein